jgi:hypothetical protein
VADAAAQGEPADTGAGNQPTSGRQPVLLGCRVEGLPRRPAASEGPPRLDINLYVIESGEVDDDPVVARGKAGNAMRTAAYRDRPAFAAGKTDGSRHVLRRRRPYDQRRPFVDRMVPYATSHLVVRVPWADHRAGQSDFQLVYRRITEYAGHDARPWLGVMQEG